VQIYKKDAIAIVSFTNFEYKCTKAGCGTSVLDYRLELRFKKAGCGVGFLDLPREFEAFSFKELSSLNSGFPLAEENEPLLDGLLANTDLPRKEPALRKEPRSDPALRRIWIEPLSLADPDKP
jgi:hypothetical protein